MDINQQIKVIDWVSSSHGRVEGLLMAFQTLKKREIDAKKVIDILEIIAHDLNRATSLLIHDDSEE